MATKPKNGQKTAGKVQKTPKTDGNRDSKGRFTKGNSGGGRPAMPDDLKKSFKEASPKALETLKRVLDDPGAKDSDKIRAAEIILDRAYGKPTQSVDLDAHSIPQVVFVGGDDVAD